MAPKTTKVPPVATTGEDNDYCPQVGMYDTCLGGDLTDIGNRDEYEERDARVDATREEFAHQDKPNKPEAWD